jgi:hypothetical protein
MFRRPITALLVILLAFASATAAQERYPALDKEPACGTLVPTAAGGPRPQNPDVIVLRFLGVANYELAHRDNIVLLDAGIDTLSWREQSGVTPEMMTKDVDAILIGHAHGERLRNSARVAEYTHARRALPHARVRQHGDQGDRDWMVNDKSQGSSHKCSSACDLGLET